jgi:hypothetical protein
MKLGLLVVFAVAVGLWFNPICIDLPPPPGCTVVCDEPMDGLCPDCRVVCPDPGGGN